MNSLSLGLGTNKLCRCRKIFLAYLCGAAATGGGSAGGGGMAGGAGASSGASHAQHTRTQSRSAECSTSGNDRPKRITSSTHSTYRHQLSNATKHLH